MLLEQGSGRVIVVWDGGSVRKGPLMRDLLGQHKRLHLERLPVDGPDLNPVEMIWSHLEYGPMADLAPRDAPGVDQVVRSDPGRLGKGPELTRALRAGSRRPPANEDLATRRAIGDGFGSRAGMSGPDRSTAARSRS